MPKASVRAHEISRPAAERLQRQGSPARVLSVFDRACNLCLGERDVVTLLAPGGDIGPFHLVVDPGCPFWALIEPGTEVRRTGTRLDLGCLSIDWGGARMFEPLADWPRLRRTPGHAAPPSQTLEDLVRRRAPLSSLVTILEEGTPEGGAPGSFPRSVSSAIHSAAVAFRDRLLCGDLTGVERATADLAGRGAGSTPAGDDFLCGAMLWAHLRIEAPAGLCAAVATTAAPRTTLLAAAFLRAAAAGECSSAWHRFLEALVLGDTDGLARESATLVSQGGTSGADTLTGWLWMERAATGKVAQ